MWLHDAMLTRFLGRESAFLEWWRSMDYTDRITDCFYDVWGSFDAEIGGTNIFPSIAALLALSPSDGDTREVCDACYCIGPCGGDDLSASCSLKIRVGCPAPACD